MKKTVLVVDDEQIVADTLSLILRRSDYNAHAIYSAEEALAYLEDTIPDLVISDVFMPGMNGVDLAVKVTETFGCCVLLISGNAGTSDLLQKSRERGFDFTLLAKPIHPLELLTHVATMVTTTGEKCRKATA